MLALCMHCVHTLGTLGAYWPYCGNIVGILLAYSALLHVGLTMGILWALCCCTTGTLSILWVHWWHVGYTQWENWEHRGHTADLLSESNLTFAQAFEIEIADRDLQQFRRQDVHRAGKEHKIFGGRRDWIANVFARKWPRLFTNIQNKLFA